MCLQPYYIYNRYIRQHILTDCGKCSSCLQAKASRRSNRIRNNTRAGEIVLFVTLTYDNRFVPYIDTRGLKIDKLNYEIPIHRNYDVRRVRSSFDYDMFYKYYRRFSPVGSLPVAFVPSSAFASSSPLKLLPLVGMPNHCVGVCYFPDVQNFMKRLRINLLRHYNYDKKFTYFCCSEYGGKTQRPHFHLLFFIKPQYETAFRCCIVESWPYGDRNRTERFIEIARDCAAYVSSYVNSNNRLSQVLQSPYTRQKHSYSQNFGVGLSEFSFREILSKIDRGDLTYSREIVVDGIRTHITLPVSSYVIGRYFPKFKGYSRLSPDSLAKLLGCVGNFELFSRVFESLSECCAIGYTYEDEYSIYIRLHNAWLRSGLDVFDYSHYYCRVYVCFFSAAMKYLHASHDIDYRSFYEEFVGKSCKKILAHSLRCSPSEIVSDIKDMPHRRLLTRRYDELYRKLTKRKYISHDILSRMDCCV